MSNRQSVLASLKKHGQSTYEDLEFATGIARDQLRQAVNDAKKAGHIAVGKDEVVGQPAYSITPAGEVWLSEQKSTGEPKGKAPKAAVVKDSLSTEKPKAEAQVQKEMDQEVRLTMAGKTIIDFCEWLAQKAQVRCPMNLHECKPIVADAIQASELVADLKASLAKAKADHSEACASLEARDDDIRRHIQRAEAAERNRDDCRVEISGLKARLEETEIERDLAWADTEEADRLRAENLALKTINESMPGFGAAHAGISKGPFVVRIPGKPAVFASKYDNAKAAAMSAARGKRGGEVFALIPLGKAIRGAEWREKA